MKRRWKKVSVSQVPEKFFFEHKLEVLAKENEERKEGFGLLLDGFGFFAIRSDSFESRRPSGRGSILRDCPS